MGLSIPFLPSRIRASALLHGSHADFVINAYLALQRQWPDEGGFAHYMHALGELGARRTDILREIANSPGSKQCGVIFVDDLSSEYDFQPEDHDSHRLIETSLTLRLARTATDVEQLRLAVSRLTAGELAQAVEGLVQAQLSHQAVLESRLNAMAAPEGAGPSKVVPIHEADEPEGTVSALKAEVAELRLEVERLRAYATVELKRQVADYVNALSSATQPQPAAARASSARDVKPGRAHIHAVERTSRSGT